MSFIAKLSVDGGIVRRITTPTPDVFRKTEVAEAKPKPPSPYLVYGFVSNQEGRIILKRNGKLEGAIIGATFWHK